MTTSDLVRLAIVVGPLLTLIGSTIWWFLKRHLNNLHREVKALKEKNSRFKEREEDLRRQVQQLAESLTVCQGERAELKAKDDVLKEQLDGARVESAACNQQLKSTKELVEDLEQQLHERVESYQKDIEASAAQIRQLTDERDRECDKTKQAKADASQLTAQLEQLNKQIEEVIKQDERVWERPVTGLSFQSLSRREVPIIAVLNLKGGVGKTTITANLAGLMAQQGKKVLAIDADYQRNLSMLLVSDKDRKMLHLEQRTFQHFLSGANRSLTTLLWAASEVAGYPDYRVVTNSDALKAPLPSAGPVPQDTSLEDVEMRLMAEWMFRQNGPDVRLRLREALHDLRLKENGYRYVLIDCPPRLSTACVNALAASDFILVPVLLEVIAARSVPNLLRTMRRLLSDGLFPHLRCLGVVANDVTLLKEKPISQEATIWRELPVACRIAWESNVYQFETMVPHSNHFAKADGSVFGSGNSPGLPLKDSTINQTFTSLLQEIEMRVEHESKLFATVPS